MTQSSKVHEVGSMTDIFRAMQPDKREMLAQFRAATEEGRTLPVTLDTLPSGFIDRKLEDGNVVGSLTEFGMSVAVLADTIDLV